VNRTEETAKNLASELDLNWAPFSDLQSQIDSADVILVSTGAMEPVLFSEHLENRGPKLVIDLSVPRNVDISARELNSVTLVDVDMLSRIKDETLQMRRAEVPKAEGIIKEHITEFMEWYNMRKYIPVMNEVKEKLRDIYIAPAFRAVNNIPLDATQEEAIKKIVNSFAAKIRRNNSAGCFYIEAINDYIEING
jgi:glutamyl-tRNA reductase